MDIELHPGALKGEINIPASKSYCHRAIIGASLSKGSSNLENILFSKDIHASIAAMESLGTKIEINQDKLTVKGEGYPVLKKTEINCNESGSTLRFLIPIALLQQEEVAFDGRGRLRERPLTPYIDIFKEKNIAFSKADGLPLKVKGPLAPGEYRLAGNVSSQFVTGLLYALPLLEGDSKLVITTELESKGYVDMTLDVLSKFSVQIENKNYREFYIKGNQQYKPIDYRVEGDFSQAAFWLCAGTINGDIVCKDINLNSLQGDKAIINILKEMGAKLEFGENSVSAKKTVTHGITIDASECPDLVPVLAVIGALSEGTTRIINAGRLRIKESDRLKAVATELNNLGAKVEELEDSLIIEGVASLKGGMVNTWNDHRIAMAMAIASLKCVNPVIIKESDCINKSYPGFFHDFADLGGITDEWSLG